MIKKQCPSLFFATGSTNHHYCQKIYLKKFLMCKREGKKKYSFHDVLHGQSYFIATAAGDGPMRVSFDHC